MKTETIRLSELKTECIKALKNAGCDDANADAIASTVCAAERDHCHSHGVFRMPGYLKSIRNGKAKADAAPTWEKIAPGVIRGDGDNGFAPLSLKLMGPELASLAKAQGVACLALTNMHHFAAMWPEMEMMTDEGLVAMTMTSAFPIVPPPGGKKPLFGTNPFAFGWPRHNGEAVIFDMATASKAHGETETRSDISRDTEACHGGAGGDAGLHADAEPRRLAARRACRGRCRPEIQDTMARSSPGHHAQQGRRVSPFRLERLFLGAVAAHRACLSGAALPDHSPASGRRGST
jgi:delta1-piperideine-2-carboxylate reductase